MIREDVWQKISEPTQPTPVKDIVIDRQELRGNGFFYLRHPTRENSFLIAHGGHGGQMLVFDRQTKITIAILRNGLRKSVLAHPDTERIIHETFKLLDAEHKPLT
ncbi:unnamed protein product [Anisakis simplex]|uniref:Beta-lactamase domain-containing protein n=1 Tax=Anisakis simplex TaxID=6269 RepID=A0A0M3JB06_ANISI|nr:unnamed protein product [Anisakis simplex]